MLKITIENALLASADIFQKKMVQNICVFLRNFFCHYTRCRQNDYFNILASYPVSRLYPDGVGTLARQVLRAKHLSTIACRSGFPVVTWVPRVPRVPKST